MGQTTNVNSRRRDLPPIDEPLNWQTAVSLLLACFVAIFFVVGFWDVAVRTLDWLAH